LTSGGHISETNFVHTSNAVDETITGTKTFNNNVIAAGYKIPNGTANDMLCGDGSTNSLANLVTIDSD
jgi:hypothetical protein